MSSADCTGRPASLRCTSGLCRAISIICRRIQRFIGLPPGDRAGCTPCWAAVKVDEVTAAAVAEALRRADTVKAAAEALDRSRGFIYDSLRRRQREWASADWVAYGAELRRRLLAGWTVAELSRRINLSE